MVNSSTLRAASRLSPRMIGYHLKRAGRNHFAGWFPGTYAKYIDRVAASLPPLSIGRSPVSLNMARQVSTFYYDEYLEQADDAARGKFTFFGESVDFGNPENINWHHELSQEKDLHLWRMKLAHMGFSCAMLMSGKGDHSSALSRMIETYRLKANFDRSGCFSSYWFPYSVSHRILSLLSGYLIAREARDLPEALCIQIEEFLRWNAGFVLANIEHELKNNHVERNLAALCLYLSNVEAVPARLARRIDRDVAEIIRACILEDGLLAERSAMYQGLSVMSLRIFAAASFLSSATKSLATEKLAKAERAWAIMTHPDGKIALFNDSWFGEVPEAGTVMDLPELRPIEMLPDAGYVRLSGQDIFAIMDSGPIGPRWNPGHGHADFLSVEVDVGQERFIVDPGTYQYSTGPRRAFERSARSHNGPVFHEFEPVEYHGCFRVGRMVSAHFLTMGSPEDGNVVGELSLPRGRLRRSLRLLPEDAGLAIEDEWAGEMAHGGVRLLIPAEWELLGIEAQQANFKLHRADAPPQMATVRVETGLIEKCADGEWASHYLKSKKAHTLVLRPESGVTSGARLCWQVRTG